MLVNNSMRFGTDEFILSKYALLTSKTLCWDLTNQSTIEGFEISGNEPEGTSRRIVFETSDGLYKFDGNTLVEYSGAGDFADVIINGNTVAELLSISNITIPEAFIGKRIAPRIALEAAVDAEEMPSIKIGIKVKSNQMIYTKTIYSEVVLSNNTLQSIISITPDTSTVGNGDISINVAILDENNNWSEYMPIPEALNQQAKSLNFKITYTVSVINSNDSAKLNSITIHTQNSQTTFSGDDSNLYTIPNDYEVELETCSMTIKHSRIKDNTITSYVCFMDTPKHRDKINIGTGTGSSQNLVLGLNNIKDNNIDINSLKIYSNGSAVSSYDFDTSDSTITLTTTSGNIITASYDYNLSTEEWEEMERQGNPQPYSSDTIYAYMSRFLYTLNDNERENKTVSAIKIRTERLSGTVSNYPLGKATGVSQQFVLEHAAKEDTISVNGEYTYDPSTKILTVTASKGTSLVISYDYEGESLIIYSFTAGWSAAT